MHLQLILVTTPNWEAVEGTLCLYERDSFSHPWQKVGHSFSINVGKNGMAWGRGLHLLENQGPIKKEGDRKAPAGIFSLGSVFGNEEHKSHSAKMPFVLVEDDLEAIDDPSSRYYNYLVKRSSVNPDWKSSEKMKEVGFLYHLGIVVEHNYSPVIANAGSCIFMHIWRQKREGSGGCTVMEEKNLIQMVTWLSQEKRPLLVQLPFAEYEQKQKEWNLP